MVIYATDLQKLLIHQLFGSAEGKLSPFSHIVMSLQMLEAKPTFVVSHKSVGHFYVYI